MYAWKCKPLSWLTSGGSANVAVTQTGKKQVCQLDGTGRDADAVTIAGRYIAVTWCVAIAFVCKIVNSSERNLSFANKKWICTIQIHLDEVLK